MGLIRRKRKPVKRVVKATPVKRTKAAKRRPVKVVKAPRTREPLLPTEAQSNRLYALATTRQMVEGVVSTRVERVAAMGVFLRTATREDARQAISVLARRPIARAWIEKTPAFLEAHEVQTARLEGRPALITPRRGSYYHIDSILRRRGLDRPDAVSAPRVMPPLDDDDRAILDAVMGRRPRRDTADEVAAWFASRVVRDDDVFGPVLVGEWS